MGQYQDLQARKDELIRKPLEGSVFIAPYTAAAIATLTTGEHGDLAVLPAGYEDAGWLDSTGPTFGSGISTTEIPQWGSPEPARVDITKRTSTVKVIMQETKLLSIGVYTGTDSTTIIPDDTSGEVRVPQTVIPGKLYYRLLVLAVDETENGEIYIARFLPRASPTALDDQSYQNGSSALDWGVTFTASADPVLGYASEYLFGGPGWRQLLEDMNFIGVLELYADTVLDTDTLLYAGGIAV